MKAYLKPDLEYVSLVAEENITNGQEGDLGDGETDLESSPW